MHSPHENKPGGETDLLRQMLDAMPVPVALVDLRGNVLYWRKDLESLFGYTADEIPTSDAWWQLAYPDEEYRAQVRQTWDGETLRAIREKSQPELQEWMVTCKDGTRKSIEFSEAIVGDNYLVMFKDITDRKKQEARILESEARFRTLAEASFESIVISSEGIILDVNDQFTEMSGYTREELIGKAIPPMIAPESREAVAEAVRTHKLGLYEHVMLRKDGQRVHIETRAKAVPIGDKVVRIAALRDITERKRAEQALRFTQYVMDNMSDAAYWIAHDGRFLYVNDAAVALVGYTKEELLNMTIGDISPDRTPANWSAHWQALRTEGKLAFETLHRAKDGRLIPVEVTANLVEFEGEAYNCAFIRDITERKQAENALRDSEEMLRQSQHVARLGHYDLDTASAVWSSSDTLDQIFGIGPDYERTIEGWYQLIHPEDRDELRTYLVDHVLTKRNPFDKEYRIIRQNDGELRWVHGLGETKVSTVGETTRMFGVIQDITERKRTEEAFSESSQMLRLVLDTIPAYIFWKDRNSVYLGCCDLFTRNAGLASSDEIVGKTDFDLPWRNTEAEAYVADDQAVMASGIPKVNFEETQHTADGRIVNVLVSKIPLRNADGEIIGVLGTAEDVTERRKAEYALRESQRMLSTLMDNLPGMAYRCLNDRDWTMEFVNEASFALTGYPPEALIGNAEVSYNDLIHPDDRETVWQGVQAGVQAKVPFVLSYRIRTKSGEEKWVWEQGRGVFSDDGSLLALEGLVVDVTERRRAEEALRAEKAFSDDVIDSIPGLFVLFDETGHVVRYNKDYPAITGYSEPELADVTILDWLAPRDHEKVAAAVQRAHTEGRAEVDVTQVLKDGTERYFHFSGLSTEIDERSYLIVTGFDITERKQAEEAVLREKAVTDAIFDSVPGTLYLFNEQGCLVRWNKRFEEESFYPPEQMPNVPVPEWPWTGDSRSAVEAALDRIATTGQMEVEASVLAKGGIERVYLFTGKRLTIDGTPCVVGMGIDITERKRNEEELALTNEELRVLNRLISETTAVADLQSILGMAVDEALRIVGLEGGTICLIRPDDVFELAAHRATSAETIADIETEQIRVGECLCGMCAKTGTPLILRTEDEVLGFATREALRREEIKFHAAFPLMLELRCVGVLCVFTRTDRKPTERSLRLLETAAKQIAIAVERARLFEEVRRNAEELEHRVAERTSQLESANKEMESFSYSVSHDLRAPLRAIDGFSLVVLEDYSDKVDEEGRKYLDRIRSAAVKMGHLIDDILRLSRITRAEMVRRRISLSEMVKSIGADLIETQPDRRVDLIVEPDLFVDADANLMRIALENLIGNAWKFTGRRDTARIEFGVLRERGKEAYYVRDNGAGFDQAYAEKLFGAFQRLHSEAEFPGTGVGLATVKRIIHRHGGEIWAVGEVDKGATFYFTLEGGR